MTRLLKNVVFSNAYKAEPLQHPVQRCQAARWRDIVEGEFEFELVQDGKVIQTVKNAAADESGAAPVSFDGDRVCRDRASSTTRFARSKAMSRALPDDDRVYLPRDRDRSGTAQGRGAQGDNGTRVFKNVYEKQASPAFSIRVLPPDDGDDDGVKLPQTGDTAPILPLVVLVLAAGVATVAVLRLRRR